MYEKKFRDRQYTLGGLKSLAVSSFSLVVTVFVAVLAILLAVVLGRDMQSHLFRVVDRFWWLIAIIAAWALAFALVFTLHAYHPIGEYLGAKKQRNEELSNQIRAVTSLPAVQTPIDFHYVESKRIDALYSQLEPELVEKQRTVAPGELKWELKQVRPTRKRASRKGRLPRPPIRGQISHRSVSA